MLARCLRTVRRPQHSPAYTLRQLRIRGIRIESCSHATEQGPRNPSESSPDPQPWEQSLKTPLRHPGAKNIIIDDLQATVDAHRLAPIIRKIKLRPKETSIVPDSSINENGEKHLRKERPIPSTQQLEEQESTCPELGKPGEQAKTQHQAAFEDFSSGISDPDARTPLRGQWAITKGQVGGEPQRPWLKFIDNYTGDAMQRLSSEIRAFENYMTLTRTEKLAAKATTLLIQNIAEMCGPNFKTTFHGSRCTGLASPYSDIDVAFAIPEFEKEPGTRGPSPTRPEAKKSAEKLLRKVYLALRKQPIRVNHVEMVFARIPLVIGYDSLAKIRFQCMALTPVRTSLEFTAYYLSEYPNLRPLFFLLRQALDMRCLNVVKDGGLSSYPLLIMILTALNHDPGHIPRDDLASQLLHVLKFWSEADLFKNGYSADPPRVFSKTSKTKMALDDSNNLAADPYLRGIDLLQKLRHDQPFLLCLQDPGDPVNDLGKKAFLIPRIQRLFRFAHDKIAERMREWENILDAEQRGDWSKSMLDSLVKGAYGNLEEQRRHVQKRFSTRKKRSSEQLFDKVQVVFADGSARGFNFVKHPSDR